MKNEKILNFIKIIILILFLGILIWTISFQQKKINQLNLQIQDLTLQYKSLEIKEQVSRQIIADIWFSMRDENVIQIIKDWGKEHIEFNECTKTIKDLIVMRNWYNYEDDFFNNVVIEYKLGNQVFYKNGTIKCFPNIIYEMDPANISCEKLCED